MKAFSQKKKRLLKKNPYHIPSKKESDLISTTGRAYSSLFPKQDSKGSQIKNCSSMKIVCRDYLGEVEHSLHVFFDTPNQVKEIF